MSKADIYLRPSISWSIWQAVKPLGPLFYLSLGMALGLNFFPQTVNSIQTGANEVYQGIGKAAANVSRLILPGKSQQDLSKQEKFISNKIATAKRDPKDAQHLAQIIVKKSEKFGFDPLLVTELIFVESSFRTTAVSPKGAQGLMQLMPATARYLYGKLPQKVPYDLNDPKLNITLGLMYLREMLDRYDNNLELALYAYNWGPTNLSRALRSGKAIPKSVNGYAKTIISRRLSVERVFVDYKQEAPKDRLEIAMLNS